MRLSVISAVLAMALAAPAMGQTTNTDTFKVKTGSDLVALCDVSTNDPNYMAAIHFCHGFVVGAFQFYLAQVGNNAKEEFICLPNPGPSRSEGIRAFVAWAKARPETASEKPVDTLFHYLGETYPCKP